MGFRMNLNAEHMPMEISRVGPILAVSVTTDDGKPWEGLDKAHFDIRGVLRYPTDEGTSFISGAPMLIEWLDNTVPGVYVLELKGPGPGTLDPGTHILAIRITRLPTVSWGPIARGQTLIKFNF